MNDAEQAISLLRGNSVPVEERAYGFSLQHHELADCDFAQCGFDNDSSISLSVDINEDPPVQWFFRISFTEMAEFIVATYQATKQPTPSRKDIVKSMRALDKDYDDRELDKMTEQFLAKIDSE